MQTPDSRSPVGAHGLSPRFGAPFTAAVLHAQLPPEVRLLALLFVLRSFLPSTPYPSRAPASTLRAAALRAAAGSESVSLLNSRQAVAAPRFPGHRVPTSGVFFSPQSAYLRAALSPSYLGQRGGSRSQAGKETSFLLSSPGSACEHSFSMVISDELKRCGKAARRRPAWVHLPPSSSPFESPCHSSCYLLWGGFVFGAVSRTPSFSVHSAPPQTSDSGTVWPFHRWG